MQFITSRNQSSPPTKYYTGQDVRVLKDTPDIRERTIANISHLFENAEKERVNLRCFSKSVKVKGLPTPLETVSKRINLQHFQMLLFRSSGK